MSSRRLQLPARVVRELRTELLCEDEQERFAFVYAGTDEAGLLGGDIIAVPDEAMARQSKTACRPAPEVEREHVSDCYDQQLAPVLVHSHPFSDDPRFSSIDVEAMGCFREWLTGLFPDRSFGFAVVGTNGVEAVANGGNHLDALPVEVIGEWKLDAAVPNTASRFDPPEAAEAGSESGVESDTQSPSSDDRFDRSVRALGTDGQRRLEHATVGIIGVGGIGSLVAEQLARLGVGELKLIDPDSIEASNLPRLIGAYEHHVGKPKVDVVREHVWKSAPTEVTVETAATPVEECRGLLEDCDLLLGCVDRVTARSFVNEYAVKHLTYYIDAGVRIDTTHGQISGMTGYIHTVAPGSTACFDCLGRYDQAAARVERLSEQEEEVERERGYIDDQDLSPEPAVIHLNGICASKTVSIGVDVITGMKTPPDFIRYEDTTHEMTALTTTPSDECPTCGQQGVLGVGDRSFGDAAFSPEGDGTESPPAR